MTATGTLTPGERVRRLARSGTTPLWLLVGLIVTFGLVMTLSASLVYALDSTGSAYTVFVRQALWVAAGVVAMLACAAIPYQKWTRWVPVIVVLVFALLVMVKVPGLGISVNGARRWVGWGPIRLQASEFAKFGFLIVAAALLARKRRLLHDPVNAVVPVVFPLWMGVALLVMLEPDLGTTLVITSICFLLLFVAGVRLRLMGMLGAIGVVGVTVLAYIEPYRRARMLSFINPFEDPQGGGYQVVQGMIAMGSGGLSGVGLGASRQKWMFLPNAHTDFIFAVIGEELGMAGSLVLLLLLFLLVAYCARAARRAPDLFGTLVASGVACWIAVQTLLNIGAVTAVLPITGVPLPLVSVGGSNILVLLASLGIVINIARQGDLEVARSEYRRRRSRRTAEAVHDAV
ncbi:MAG: putative lipid II flippase FtsW [Acidimicrobiia bacterium]